MVKSRARLRALNVSVEGCNTALASCTARLAWSRVASAHGVSTMLRPARTRIGSPVTSRNLLNVRLIAEVLRFRRRAAPATLASLSNMSSAINKLKSGSDISFLPAYSDKAFHATIKCKWCAFRPAKAIFIVLSSTHSSLRTTR